MYSEQRSLFNGFVFRNNLPIPVIDVVNVDEHINIRTWSKVDENVVSVRDEDVVSVRGNVHGDDESMTWSSVDDSAVNCV